MNHHGGSLNAEFLQHGGRTSIAVMNVHKMIDRSSTIPYGARTRFDAAGSAASAFSPRATDVLAIRRAGSARMARTASA